jgi:hypothetical protein
MIRSPKFFDAILNGMDWFVAELKMQLGNIRQGVPDVARSKL